MKLKFKKIILMVAVLFTFTIVPVKATHVEGTIRKSVTDQQWETSAASIEPNEEVEEILAANINISASQGTMSQISSMSLLEVTMIMLASICVVVIINLTKKLSAY